MLDTPIGTVKGRMRLGPREAARPARRPGGGDVMSACAHRDDAGSYVLRALPDDEHERFEAHLATCEECRREVADLQVAADTLPLAAVQVDPPPELRDRIMAVVRSEAELLARRRARAPTSPRAAGRQGARAAGGAGRCSAAPAAGRAGRRPRSSRPAWSAASCSSGGDDTQTVTGTGAARLGARRRARRCSSPTTRRKLAGAQHAPAAGAARSTRCGSSARTRTRRPTTALFRTDRERQRRRRDPARAPEGRRPGARDGRARRRLDEADERSGHRRLRPA